MTPVRRSGRQGRVPLNTGGIPENRLFDPEERGYGKRYRVRT